MLRWRFAACALVLGSSAAAQEPVPRVKQPRVALVLSSGGVRGLAHVGVLQALEEQCVEVDLIVGSEWGALVGGLYAAGLTPSEIQAALLAPDWIAAIQDRRPRQTLSFRAKQEDREFLIDLPLGVDKHGLILPPGLRGGDRLRLELARMTLGTLATPRFDDLPWVFRAMATDLGNGDVLPLDSGSLAQAIEASLAIPVLWPPVEREGRTLISGAISDPLPVDVALAAQAEMMVLVDLGDPDPEPGRPTFVSVGGRVLDVLWTRQAAEARAKLRASDLLCTPDVQGVDFTELEVGHLLIERGHAAGLALAERLAPFASERGAYTEQLLQRRARAQRRPIIEHVRVAPDCALAERSVRARMDVSAGQPLDLDAAGLDLARLYGLRLFQRVDFELRPTPSGNADLYVQTEDLPTAPLHWRTGLTAELSAGKAVNFQIGAGVRWAPIDDWGSEGRLQIEAGNRLALLMEYRKTLEPSGKWFLIPSVNWEKRPVVVDQGTGAVAEFSVKELELALDLAREMGNDWEVRAGLLYRTGRSSLEIGEPTPNDSVSFNEGGLRFGLTCDSLDDTAFPGHGTHLTSEWFKPQDSSVEGHDETATAHLDYAFSWGESSLVLGAELDTIIGEQGSVQSFFPLGGFLRLSGLGPDEISGPTAALARAVYLRPFQSRGLKRGLFTWYGGASLELGNVYSDIDQLKWDELNPAGSLFLGVDTFLGPAYLGFGLAEGGQSSVFLVFGRVF